MVIIRIDAPLTAAEMERVAADLHAQAKTGVIVLPSWCSLLSNADGGDEIKLYKLPTLGEKDKDQNDADRVAALEAELAMAMTDLAAAKTCESCKHEPIDPGGCFETGYACKSCEEPGCVCHDCDNGSKWEWRANRGAE